MTTMLTTIFAAEGPNGNWIPGDVNEFWWGLAAFSVLVVVFLWKGLPAITRIMKQHTADIEAELSDAERRKAEAEQEVTRLTSELGDAGAEAEQILADARDQAARVEADLVARAEQDVAEAKERARIDIQAQRDQALADLRAALAGQARTAAEAVVRENLDDIAIQRDLIDDYITKVGT